MYLSKFRSPHPAMEEEVQSSQRLPSLGTTGIGWAEQQFIIPENPLLFTSGLAADVGGMAYMGYVWFLVYHPTNIWVRSGRLMGRYSSFLSQDHQIYLLYYIFFLVSRGRRMGEFKRI